MPCLCCPFCRAYQTRSVPDAGSPCAPLTTALPAALDLYQTFYQTISLPDHRFFVGVAFFAVIVAFIPEPDATGMVLDVGEEKPAPEPILMTPLTPGPGSGEEGARRRSSRVANRWVWQRLL